MIKWRQLKNAVPIFTRGISDFEKQYETPIVNMVSPIPMAKYGGRHTITIIPGSGIGPEMCQIVRNIFELAAVPVDFEEIHIDPYAEDNIDLENALISIRRNGVAIKSIIETRSTKPEVLLRNVAMRNLLDLYAYTIRCKSYPGVPARHQNVDIVVIRQNVEGEYAMLEHSSGQGIVESLKIITENNVRRLAKYVFDFARRYNRKKVTIVHKANIMKISDGFFLKVIKDIGKKYPDIQHDDMIVDNCSMQLVSQPQKFDVVVSPSLYGNIISNIVCGIAGGPGLYCGKNHGPHYTVFEPGTRNMGSLLAGKNIANPVSMINASIEMLYHLGLYDFGKKIKEAVVKTLTVDKVRTADIGGTNSTSEVVDKIIENMSNNKKKITH